VPAVPGNPVVDYVAACQAPGQQTRTASGSNTPIIVGGLKGGVAYNCYARARNVQGGGPSSRPVTVTARSAPTSAPTTVSGIVAGNGTIQLTPAVVDSSGDGGLGITGYAAVCQAVGQPTRTASSSGGPIILTGMRGGVTYTCVVRARNIFGGGPPSLPISVAAESSPTAAPSAVTAVVASNGRAELTPAPLANSGDGGLPINGYAALCRAPGQPNRAGMSGETSVTVTGLARGVSYTCVVRAHNQFGGGPPSPPVTVAVPHTRPVAPGRSSR
jgi:hypothetical protein